MVTGLAQSWAAESAEPNRSGAEVPGEGGKLSLRLAASTATEC